MLPMPTISPVLRSFYPSPVDVSIMTVVAVSACFTLVIFGSYFLVRAIVFKIERLLR